MFITTVSSLTARVSDLSVTTKMRLPNNDRIRFFHSLLTHEPNTSIHLPKYVRPRTSFIFYFKYPNVCVFNQVLKQNSISHENPKLFEHLYLVVDNNNYVREKIDMTVS